jgi:uncharacterized membrane protein YedE/YeeE
MLSSSFLPPLIGGALIGLSATLLLGSLGRVAGVSGILGNVVSAPKSGPGWQVGFIAGLVAAGWLLLGRGNTISAATSPTALVVAGLLVGFGTRMGSGCTSGHGVCGLSRFSRRSLVATCVFMVTAMLVVFASRHLLAGDAL